MQGPWRPTPPSHLTSQLLPSPPAQLQESSLMALPRPATFVTSLGLCSGTCPFPHFLLSALRLQHFSSKSASSQPSLTPSFLHQPHPAVGLPRTQVLPPVTALITLNYYPSVNACLPHQTVTTWRLRQFLDNLPSREEIGCLLNE